ncbi:hypothetical protein JCM10212_004248 [Sporobolomyces blumeae]
MPSSAPPSSSSLTSPVRYFDFLPIELIRIIVEHRMLVLVIHDPFGGVGDGIRSKNDPVDFFDGTPNLTHLTVQDGHPLLWMSQGTLQHLRFLRVDLNLLLPEGSRVLPVASVYGSDADDILRLARLMIAWDGHPMTLQYDMVHGVDKFVRDLLQALRDLRPLRETFKTLYLPSPARPLLAGASNERDASIDGLTLEDVEIVFEDCPAEDEGDPFTWIQVLRERVERRRSKGHGNGQSSRTESRA